MVSKGKKHTAEGDVIALRLPDRLFLGKVIFVSTVFRDVILLALFRADTLGYDQPLSSREPDLLIYTSKKCIGATGWERVGFEPVSSSERQRSRRIVGGEVWLADEELGQASATDWKTLPRMDVFGCTAVEARLQEKL